VTTRRIDAVWQHFEIAGTGSYLPRARLSAEDVDTRAGLPAGWTRDVVGVLNRHECIPPESLPEMAAEALRAALADAGLAWADMGLLLDASTCRYQPVPANAAVVQSRLGPKAWGIPCFDVQSTCLGFLVALHVANGLLAGGAYRHVAIVCAEAGLQGVNWREAESACLMGDGAAAAVLRRAAPRPTYHYAHETFAQYLDTCEVRGGGHRLPPFDYRPENDADFRFHMDGPRVFRVARKRLPPLVGRLLREAGRAKGDLQVVPHQASPRAVDAVRRSLGFEPGRFHNRAAVMGNLSAASVPTVFHQCRQEGLIARGDQVLLLGTSAGYSQAGLIFEV
jgi:3-oxoacyl-[acyl-carrier-protein] synthase III